MTAHCCNIFMMQLITPPRHLIPALVFPIVPVFALFMFLFVFFVFVFFTAFILVYRCLMTKLCNECSIQNSPFVILIGVLNLAVLVINSVLLLSMSSREYNNCTRMCLPCETGENAICCDCQVEGLQGYLTKLYERTTETSGKYKGFSDIRILSSYHDMSTYYKPAAKLSGDTENNQDKTSTMKTVKSWRNDNMCYLINGMALRQGRLVVPLAGLYHVYAMFDISLLNSTKEASIVVMKYNILKDEEILLSRPLSNWAVLSPQNNYQHIYLGADFLLNQEDEVYVKLSHTLLFKNPSANVFGLYML